MTLQPAFAFSPCSQQHRSLAAIMHWHEPTTTFRFWCLINRSTKYTRRSVTFLESRSVGLPSSHSTQDTPTFRRCDLFRNIDAGPCRLLAALGGVPRTSTSLSSITGNRVYRQAPRLVIVGLDRPLTLSHTSWQPFRTNLQHSRFRSFYSLTRRA